MLLLTGDAATAFFYRPTEYLWQKQNIKDLWCFLICVSLEISQQRILSHYLFMPNSGSEKAYQDEKDVTQ